MPERIRIGFCNDSGEVEEGLRRVSAMLGIGELTLESVSAQGTQTLGQVNSSLEIRSHQRREPEPCPGDQWYSGTATWETCDAVMTIRKTKVRSAKCLYLWKCGVSSVGIIEQL